jgi:putative DNA primase/helicase
MIACENVPEELAREHRWVTWRYHVRDGKRTKRPDQRTNDAHAWLSFEAAIANADRSRADGIGFVLGSGFVGIDIDRCIADDGELSSLAHDALESLDTYAERSPSGRGIHLILRVTFPEHSRNDRERGLEIYDGTKARFFTVTGARFTDATEVASGVYIQDAFEAFCARYPRSQTRLRTIPVQLSNDSPNLSDAAVLALLFKAKNASRARRLFNAGEWSACGYRSQSEADLALIRMLRFYTRDSAQLDRLFRGSKLMRSKWDERHGAQTYGALTIAKAIVQGGPCYGSRRKRPAIASKPFTVRPEWFPPGMGELQMRLVLAIARRSDTNGTARVRRSELSAELGITERNVTKVVGQAKAAGVVAFEVDRGGYAFHLLGASLLDAPPTNERGKRDAA